MSYGYMGYHAYPQLVKSVRRLRWAMALSGPAKYFAYEKSRRMIYIGKDVAGDSQFPFAPGDALWVRIDAAKKRLIIELIKVGRPAGPSESGAAGVAAPDDPARAPPRERPRRDSGAQSGAKTGRRGRP